MARGRSNAAAARAPRGQRHEAADLAAFATPRRNWWRVTNDNGLRADVILALDQLTYRYSPALRAEAGARPASYPILCTNLAEEDRQTKEESCLVVALLQIAPAQFPKGGDVRVKEVFRSGLCAP